jgi:hypothetical protein
VAILIGVVVGNNAVPTAGDIQVFERLEDLGFVPSYVDDSAAVPTGRQGFVITDSVTAATVGNRYDALTVPVVTLEMDLWPTNRLAANNGAATGASAAYDLTTHTITTGLADPLTVLTSAQAQRGVLNADLPAGALIFARPGADATRAMGWTAETGATLTSGTAQARRVGMYLADTWPDIFTTGGVDLFEAVMNWAFRPFTVTFDATLSRVRIATDGLGGALTAVVERSTDQVTWTRVRGGDPATVNGGALAVDDYEFTPNVANYYRVVAARDVRTTGTGFAGIAATANNVAVNPAMPTGARARHAVLLYGSVRDGAAGVTLTAGYQANLLYDQGHVKVGVKTHTGTEAAPTVTPVASAANSDVIGQTAALRNLSTSASAMVHILTLVIEQNVSFPGLTPAAVRQAIIFLGWKQTSWTSVANLTGGAYAGYVEFGEPSSTIGNDAAQVWGFKQQTGTTPETIPAGSFTVTGGVQHVTRGIVIAMAPLSLTVSGSITPTQNTVWVKNLGLPFLNRAVTVVDHSDIEEDDRTEILDVVGRRYPVAITDVRAGLRQTLTLMFATLFDANQFLLCLAPGGPVYLQVPASCPFPGMHATVGKVRMHKSSARGLRRFVTLPLTEVAAPTANQVGATLTWQSVISTYATWSAELAGESTWADLLSGIGSPADVIVP